MSFTEITTHEDGSNTPVIPLPAEIRMKIYEQLLIHPKRSLKPNGFRRYTADRPYLEKDYIFTNILRTCRTFYNEALPILYGKNTLAFHDNDFSKPVLPFPEEHLAMVKRVEVDISPIIYSSAKKMGEFLMTLGTSGTKLVDVSIRIHMLEDIDKVLREPLDPLPPLQLCDQYLVGDHPIVAGLFSLKAVKKLYIELEDQARFQSGIANELKAAFMKDGTADGRSITINKGCTFPHGELEGDGPCPGCGNTEEDLNNGTADWEYKDDWRSFQTVGKFLRLGGKLSKGKPTKANSTIVKRTKAIATKPKHSAD